MTEGPGTDDGYASFYTDPDRLDYPEADRLVAAYIRAHTTREQATSVDVLRWADHPNDHHNRQRVYDALAHQATETDTNWQGRKVFALSPTGGSDG